MIYKRNISLSPWLTILLTYYIIAHYNMAKNKLFFQQCCSLLIRVMKGIQYSDSILIDVYCTQGENWMHSAFGFDASILTLLFNSHLTLLNSYKVSPKYNWTLIHKHESYHFIILIYSNIIFYHILIFCFIVVFIK